MIEKIIDWSISNKFMVILATLFVIAGGILAVKSIPLDAIPDLSDVQVIIQTDYPGQAPRVVEDQVTYPLTTTMLSVPYAKTVRGYSFFGLSFVYIIFELGTDLYWARSRVLEYLNGAGAFLQSADYHSILSAGVFPDRPVRADVYAACLYQDLCHGRLFNSGHNHYSRADDLFYHGKASGTGALPQAAGRHLAGGRGRTASARYYWRHDRP